MPGRGSEIRVSGSAAPAAGCGTRRGSPPARRLGGSERIFLSLTRPAGRGSVPAACRRRRCRRAAGPLAAAAARAGRHRGPRLLSRVPGPGLWLSRTVMGRVPGSARRTGDPASRRRRRPGSPRLGPVHPAGAHRGPESRPRHSCAGSVGEPFHSSLSESLKFPGRRHGPGPGPASYLLACCSSSLRVGVSPAGAPVRGGPCNGSRAAACRREALLLRPQAGPRKVCTR
jgi:hypothetical protein